MLDIVAILDINTCASDAGGLEQHAREKFCQLFHWQEAKLLNRWLTQRYVIMLLYVHYAASCFMLNVSTVILVCVTYCFNIKIWYHIGRCLPLPANLEQ